MLVHCGSATEHRDRFCVRSTAGTRPSLGARCGVSFDAVSESLDDERRARLLALVNALDDKDTITAEEARFEIREDFGVSALEPLLAAAPGFSRVGQLCAIDIFERIGDPRAGAVLIPWLASEYDTVRDRAAGALGTLGVADAVPALLAAWQASKDRQTPPDWTEPVSIRQALTELGARRPVLPPVAAKLARLDNGPRPCWRPEDLEALLTDLADAGQVVLSFGYLQRRWNGKLHVLIDAGLSLEPDLTRPWAALVAESLARALEYVRRAELPPDTLARVEWLDQSDV